MNYVPIFDREKFIVLDALLEATVSCSGLEITIQCNDHDVKDSLMDFLTGQELTSRR